MYRNNLFLALFQLDDQIKKGVVIKDITIQGLPAADFVRKQWQDLHDEKENQKSERVSYRFWFWLKHFLFVSLRRKFKCLYLQMCVCGSKRPKFS
jgi:hypothetical protein